MRLLAVISLALIALFLAAPEAAAQTGGCNIGDGNNVLDCVLDHFQSAAKGWEAGLSQIALRLFWLLALIEFVWAAMLLAVRGADLSEWMASLLNQILFLGFFAALLQFSSVWAKAIIDSFRSTANIAGGAAVIRPSDIFDVGVKLGSALIADLSVINLAFSLVLILAAFFLLVAFGLIAATLIVALVESYIIISAGVLMMGFGGSRWTKDFAVRTFQYGLSVGAKLFIIQLLAELMITITEPWTTMLASDLTRSWTGLFVLLGISIVFVSLIRTIPELVQALVNGASLSSGAGLYGTATGIATGAAAGGISAGLAAASAGRLAGEQLRNAELSGAAPTSAAGRAGWLGVRSMANLGGSAARTIGDRLSGRVPPHGTRLGQMAGDMDRAREALAKKREADAAGGAPQPSTPSGSP
jgi:type IV secretion system protein TrbL